MPEEVQETTWLIRNGFPYISELLQQNINKITQAKINGRATVLNIIMYQITVIIIVALKKRKEIKLKKIYTCNMAEEIIINSAY